MRAQETLAQSLSKDIVYALSNGKFLTLKHTALAIGLHSITGLKIPIIILSRLGHCITNDKVREIETAQAEQAEELYQQGKSLPVILIVLSIRHQEKIIYIILPALHFKKRHLKQL